MKRKTYHFILWPCLVVFFGVLGWLSYSVLNLEKQRALESAQTRLEEQTRLALWRMDSALTAFLSKENNRPPQDFFYLAGTKEGDEERHIPLGPQQGPEPVKLYFQIGPDEKLVSPQCPESFGMEGVESSSASTQSDFKALDDPIKIQHFLLNAGIQDRTFMLRTGPESVITGNFWEIQRDESPSIPNHAVVAGNVINIYTHDEETDLTQQEQAILDYGLRTNISQNTNSIVAQANIRENRLNKGDPFAAEGEDEPEIALPKAKSSSLLEIAKVSKNSLTKKVGSLDRRRNEKSTVLKEADLARVKKEISLEEDVLRQGKMEQSKKISPDIIAATEGKNRTAGTPNVTSLEKFPPYTWQRGRYLKDLFSSVTGIDEDSAKIALNEMKSGLIQGWETMKALPPLIFNGEEFPYDQGVYKHPASELKTKEVLDGRSRDFNLSEYRYDLFFSHDNGLLPLKPKSFFEPGESFILLQEGLSGDDKRRDISISEHSISISAFAPHWIDGDLYLLRTVKTNSGNYVQGIWLDWERLQDILLAGTGSALPNARLIPFREVEVTRQNVSRILAALPLLIDPGELPGIQDKSHGRALKLTLGMAWMFALAAVAGVVLLLGGVVRLSDRRATFVSAVTHELRTPLTTFLLYTEMLKEGLVPEQKRFSYLSTLQREASRLMHMVDNVLSFSRIEKTRTKRHFEKISVQELRDIIVKYINIRLHSVDMEVQDTMAPHLAEQSVETDCTALEQIFHNFADNVAKYAAIPGSTVELHFSEENKRLVICFKDHGSGLPSSVRKKLFKPFSRSAEEAAGKKPGVGLGLALSREIARDLGGDLKLDKEARSGTSFLLYLPLS